MISQRRGKASNHRLEAQVVQQALDLIKKQYSDFGLTLAHEKLQESDQVQISRESVRKIMMAEGMWKPRRKKKEGGHQTREQRACFGELIQIDGSNHAWFEGRDERCTLLVFIDDATGQLVELHFVTDESFFAYGEAARSYFQRCGKPLAFYSDRHVIFRVNVAQALGSKPGLTQFGRAMQELDIQIICANTPQAKGRAERVIQTLQNRLVKELRLRNISSLEAGNAFLPDTQADFNQRFAVHPRSTQDAHHPLQPTQPLRRILSWQKQTHLSKNLTLQCHKVIYQIQTEHPFYTLQKAAVTICENGKGQVTILYKDQKLSSQSTVVDTKHLNRSLPLPKPPAADHPWRTYGKRLNGKEAPPGSS